MPIFAHITLIAFILFGTGCGKAYQEKHVETSNFLSDYALLKKGQPNDALLSYWKSGTDWASYKKVIVEPVAIRKIPHSKLSKLPHADNYRLKELLNYRIREALKKDFKLVNKSGPDTLRVQFAITDADTESYIGKVSVEGKITDSLTGELLMASVDCRAGGKALIGTFNGWDDIGLAYQYWAAQLSHQLCEKQGHSACLGPERYLAEP